MSMVKIDPELFVTCRLCLQDKGSYQIVPAVKYQIQFCFNIDVDPFDGLPQLLCTKCETILSEYFKTKTLFIDKQNYLINRLQGKHESPLISQQEAVSSSQQTDHEKNVNLPKAKKRRANISSTSSDADSNEALIVTECNKSNLPTNTAKSLASWKNGYEKHFLCRLCRASRTKKSAVLRHVRIHEHLKAKHGNAFKKFCTVKLIKIDDAPNITGTKNAVVYSHQKIIQGDNLDYVIVYSKPATNISDSVSISDDNEMHNYKSDVQKPKKDESSDSSEEDVIVSRKRKRRLVSRSSSETVVIATDNRYDSTDTEEVSKIKLSVVSKATESIKSDCINIDDSSDSTSNENNVNLRSKKKKQSVRPDYKMIHNIVSMCRKNYLAKYDCDKNKHPASTESQLKHKILSIGMKIINKQGFNCTGLLRFMEHRNLDIVWLANITKESNYVRIMTKLRRGGECDKNDSGWKNISSLKMNKVNKLETRFEAENIGLLNSNTTMNKNLNENDISTEADSGALYSICNLEIKKLLNANPVANPKQLPKKSVVNETKNISVKTMCTNQNICNVDKDGSVSTKNTAEDPDTNLCMPIITSTTSLATDFLNNKNDKEYSNNEAKSDTQKSPTNQSVSDISIPRIKVKPASELMSERVLNYNTFFKEPVPVINTLHERQQISIPYDNLINVYIPNAIVTQIQNTGQSCNIVEIPDSSNVSTVNMSSESSVNTCDYVILDTPELPNTKTDSPFKYFKKLLQIHNITLLDTSAILQNFICLIKFKVLFKQDTMDQPVILCLSLFCLGNNFCLKIKNRNQEDISVEKISANWQWEILKIYMGDVVSKILRNAQRVGQEIYEYTNNFLCLLKSIDYKKHT